MSERDEFKECPVCFEAFTQPTRLSCDHTLCKPCVNQMTKQSQIRCPKCNRVSKTTQLKPDFRLVQFLDELEKQAQFLTGAQNDSNHCSTNCELCTTKCVTHRCEDCEQWICRDCKIIHLRANSTHDHNVTSLVDKTEKIKLDLIKESDCLKEKASEYENVIRRIEAAVEESGNIQTTTLTACYQMRKLLLAEVNQIFDKYDTKIIGTIDDSIQKYKAEKTACENQLADIEMQRQQLGSLISENGVELASTGREMLKQSKEILGSLAAPELKIEQSSFELLRNEAWSVTKAVTLCLSTGDIKTENVASSLPSQTERTTWIKNTEADIPGDPNALRVINNSLWCCHTDGITVYTGDLAPLRTISRRSTGHVHDVAQLENGELIVAAKNGLFHLDATGETKLTVVDKTSSFSSVLVIGDTVYAANWKKKSEIRAYKLIHSSEQIYWSTTREWTLQLPCHADHLISMIAQNDTITACCSKEVKLYKLSLSGELLHTYGEPGFGVPGKLDYPYIGGVDVNGKILVLDSNNHRIQSLSIDGMWDVLHLKQQVDSPRSAVYFNGDLYLSSNDPTHYAIYRYTEKE